MRHVWWSASKRWVEDSKPKRYCILCEILPWMSRNKGIFPPEKGRCSGTHSDHVLNATRVSREHRRLHSNREWSQAFLLEMSLSRSPQRTGSASNESETPSFGLPSQTRMGRVTPKKDHAEPHRTGQLIMVRESIHRSVYQMINRVSAFISTVNINWFDRLKLGKTSGRGIGASLY